MVFFRVDGNSKIGTGHMIRCLAIAEKVRSLGAECTFICADENYKTQIESNGHSFHCLNTQWDDMDSEIPALSSFLDQNEAYVMLIDSYKVTSNYLLFLTNRLYTVYIDDLGEMVYPCSAVINYTLYWKHFSYQERYKHSATELLLGTRYVPLRKEYEKIPAKKISTDLPCNILITTGGTDAENYTERILACLLSELGTDCFSYTVVCGKYNRYYSVLAEKYRNQHGVTILNNVTDMCSLMKASDMVVSSSGTTLFEIAATGTPAVCFILADNQILNAESFAAHGISLAGDIRHDADVPLKIANNVHALFNQCDKRKKMSLAEQSLIDGEGCKRIAEQLICNS